MIDLHTHTTASDGTFSPEELVHLAKQKGLTALALTDHDTFSGIAEAQKIANDLKLRFLPGIEVEIDIPKGIFHLLGLDIKKWDTDEAKRFIVTVKNNRIERNKELLERLQKDNYDIREEYFLERGIGNNLSMMHIAKWFVEHNYSQSVKEVFLTFLASDSPYYIPKVRLDLEKTCAFIKELGGRPVLAHPLTLRESFNKLPSLLENFKERGLEGLECWYSKYNGNQCRRLEKLANEIGLFPTGGSDFHGRNRPTAILGYGGKKKIDDRFLEIFDVTK